MNVPRFAVKYPISVSMLFLGIVLLGAISLQNLGTDLLPDLASPKIVVRLEAGERPPEEMERRYSRNIESFVSTINNVKNVSSSSLTGVSVVTIEFSWDTDMDFALLDVQKAIAQFSSDTEVESIAVDRYDPRTAPIMTVSVSPRFDQELDEIRNDVEKVIKRRLERIDGVAAAALTGGREKEVVIRLRPYHLLAYELTPSAIIGRIQGANVNQAGGRVEDNEKIYIVKGIGEFQNLEDIRELVVGYKDLTVSRFDQEQAAGSEQQTSQQNALGARPTQVPVFLSDVADVEFLDKEYTSVVRYNGKEGIGIAIYKEAQSNTVTTSNIVNDELEELRKDFPRLELIVAKDQADFINAAIDEVEYAAMLGVVLAIVILTLFLRNFWSTVIVAFSIPISIIATFNLMYFNDLSLNMMTLGGLALGAGMLVDNSIVVMENIYRHLKQGKSPADAATTGTSEVGTAILASTVTTIIVFMPIIYVKGVGAELFKDQAFTVAFSLISSLIVAFLLIPAFAAKFIKNKSAQAEKRVVRSWFYHGLLKSALNLKWVVVSVAFLAGFLAFRLLGTIGTEFIPKSDQGQFTLKIRLPEGTKVQTTSNVAKLIEDLIIENSNGFVASVYSEIGEFSTEGFYSENDRGSNTGLITVTMQQQGDNRLPTADFIEALQPALEQLPEVRSEFILEESAVKQTMGGFSGGLAIMIKGPEIDMLETLADEIASEIVDIEGLYNVKTSFQEGRPEINISMKNIIAAGLGLAMNDIIDAVRDRLSENVASEFHFSGTERDIRVAYPKIDTDELEKITITTSGGAVVSLKNVAKFTELKSPKEILREDQSRYGLVLADLKDEVKYSTVVNAINEKISGVSLPRDYRVEVTGEEKERQAAFADLKFALILAIVLVYMVLASLFESFIHPFTILLAVPMAGIGSVLIFFILDIPLSIMAFIGIIMLAGIAVNDAIIFVDYINTLRSKGMERMEAILQAGQDRLRPIMMTSLTTILALTPLVLGVGEGAKLRAPLAYAVIGGLVTSTIMTLIITPCLYSILDNFRPKKYRDKDIVPSPVENR